MKTKYLNMLVVMLLFLSGCNREESITPTSICTTPAAIYHSKGEAFQNIIDNYTAKGLPGIALLIKRQ